MAIALRAAGTAKQVASGDLAAVSPASTASGDLLIALVSANDNVSLTFPDTTPVFRAGQHQGTGADRSGHRHSAGGDCDRRPGDPDRGHHLR